MTHTKSFYSTSIRISLIIIIFQQKQALNAFGYNPYIEDNISLQSGSYYPSPNAVIEEKNVRNRQKWNKNDAGMTSIDDIILLCLYKESKLKEFVA